MKHNFKQIISSLVAAVMLSMTAMPAAIAIAEEVPTEPAATTETTEPAAEPAPAPAPAPEPEPTTTGPTEPTGPAAPTGVIPKYAFDKPTGKWVPTRQETFYYDYGVGRYVSPYYSFNSQNGWYYTIPTPPPSTQSTASPELSSSTAPASGTGGSAADYESAKSALAALLGLSDPLNSNTGAGSTNTGTLNNASSALVNILAAATINNTQDSTAVSGDASVAGNSIGGSATTGMASVISNFLNLINSAWSWSNGGLSYFLGNFFGDHTGDVNLNPTSTSGGGGSFGCYFCFGGSLNANENTGPDSVNTATTNTSNQLDINYQPTGTINNDINLLAQSGDASVTGNTQAGDAATGNAIVELNILNMINSAIGSGNSFFGLLNIFGSLNGDILFPSGFLNGSLGTSSATGGTVQISNTDTGPESTNTATHNDTSSATINDNSVSTFNNNVNTAALSGNALVSANTSAGSAGTGDAATNTTLHNLYNVGVTGDNAVLVLVNVLGRWIGMIMDVPSYGGSSSALLGGNAVVSNSNTGPNSINTATNNVDNTLNVNYAPTSTINNNITAGAISGNASVSGNTAAGSATSGDAMVATNIVNIMGSQLNLRNWFGVLVINVFGDWFGSVGKDTEAGSTLGVGGSSTALETSSNSTSGPVGQSSQTNSAASSGASMSASGSGGSAASASAPGVNIKLASSPNVAKVAAAKKSAANTSVLFVLMGTLLAGAGALISLERKLRR